MKDLKALPKFSRVVREHLSATEDVLTVPFFYFHPSGSVVVPAGFISDGDSVPRVPLVYALFKGRAKRAAWVHDYLYRTQAGKRYADQMFLDAMEDEGVADWLRYPIYWAVVLRGGPRYDQYKAKVTV